MKEEKKYLYALTKKEAGAAVDACNRVTADSPRNLSMSNSRFDACDRAAYALAQPEIDAEKIVLVLTKNEFTQLDRCFGNGYDNGLYSESHCPTSSEKKALEKARQKLTEQHKKVYAK